MIDSLTRIIQASLLQLRWLSVVAMLLAALVSPYILGPSALTGRLLMFTGAIASHQPDFHAGRQVPGRGPGCSLVLIAPDAVDL
jgi:hypothetical protein